MTQDAAGNRPTIAAERSDRPTGADDLTERPLCVCGALALEELMPMLRKASEAFAEVRHVIPTLEEVNRRLTVLETADYRSRYLLGASEDHVCVYVDGFDRCSWCGVAR